MFQEWEYSVRDNVNHVMSSPVEFVEKCLNVSDVDLFFVINVSKPWMKSMTLAFVITVPCNDVMKKNVISIIYFCNFINRLMSNILKI